MWAKGQSGNPNGRPRRGQSLSEILRGKLAEDVGDGQTRAERIIAALFALAEGGDIRAIEAIFERVEGKVTDRVDLRTRGKTVIEVVYGNGGANSD